MFINTNFNNRKGNKAQTRRERTLKLEALEVRELLSVSPLYPETSDEVTALVSPLAATETPVSMDELDASDAGAVILSPMQSSQLGAAVSDDDHAALETRTTKYITPSGYNDNDYQKMVAFLDQVDSNGITNGSKINKYGYNPFDPLTFSGVNWDMVNGEYRITAIGAAIWSLDLVGNADFSDMKSLRALYCQNNQITSLDVSGCSAMIYLECETNRLSNLNVTGCSALQTLNCSDNQLYSLNLVSCSQLVDLYCNNNHLTTLNVSNHKQLSHIICNSNNLRELNASGCTNLRDLFTGYICNNPLEIINLSGCEGITFFNYNGSASSYTRLKELNLSGCTSLDSLECEYGQLTSLNVSGCNALRYIKCSHNQLSQLDLRNTYVKLTSIYIDSNPNLTHVFLSRYAINSLTVFFEKQWSITDSKGTRKTTLNASTPITYSYCPTELPFTATNPAGTQTVIFTSNVTSQLAAPTLSVSPTGPNSISVTIGSVTNASGYTVQYSKYSNFTPANTITYQTSGYHSINGLDANATYYVRVKANGTGNYSDSSYSGYYIVKTNSQTTQLTGLTLSTNSPIVGETLFATITPSTSSCTYQWSYSASASGTYYAISGATSASYTPTSAYIGKYLKCTVTGTGNYAGTVSAATANPVIQVTDNVGDSISNAKDITFTNDAFTFTDKLGEGIYGLKDVDIYKLFVSAFDINRTYTFTTSLPSGGSSVDTYISLFDSAGNELVFDDDSGNDNRYSSLTWTPPASGSYYLGVSSYSNNIYNPLFAGSSESDGTSGDYTLTVTRTGSIKLQAPTLSVSKSLTTSDSITIYIGNVANASGFKVQYATDSNFTDAMEIIFTQSGNNTIYDLESSKMYYFRVMALGSDNYSDSDFSSTKSETTNTAINKINTPTFTVDVTGSDSVSINVESVPHASGYKVQYSQNANFTNPEYQNLSSGSNTINGLSANTTYYFRVMAIASTNYTNSSYSVSQSVCTDYEYAPSEVACLRSFLEQTDSNGVKNGVKINSAYSPDKTSTWTGVTWSDFDGVMRVTEIEWEGKELHGSLNLSACTELTFLNVSDTYNEEGSRYNYLTHLDVTGCASLEQLCCDYNQLTSLDVRTNTHLCLLKCCNNYLTELDLSNNSQLWKLYCDGNLLSSLDVTHNPLLSWFGCSYNSLTSLDLSNNTALLSLSCSANLLSSLDVSNNTAMTMLYCYSNQFSILDVSNNTALGWLDCCSSDLRIVRISPSAEYMNIYFGSVIWTFLDVDGNTISDDALVFAYNASDSASLPITAVKPYDDQTIRIVNAPIEFLDAPTFTVTVTGSNSVSVNVDGVTNASGYTVEYSDNPNFFNAKTRKINSLTASLDELVYDSVNYIRVKANGTGPYVDSDYSSVQAVALGAMSTAKKDYVQTAKNTPITIDYRANDDVTNWPLTTVQFGEPSHGVFTVNANGTITYTPENGFFGMDSITYGVVSPSGRIDIGEISIYAGSPIAASVQDSPSNHNPSMAMAPNVDSLTDWDNCYVELWAQGVNSLSAGSVTVTLEYNPEVYNVPVFSDSTDGVTWSVSQSVLLSNGNAQVELTAQVQKSISSQTDNLYLGTVILTPSEEGEGVNNVLTPEPVCVLNGASLTQTVAAMPYDLVHNGAVDVNDFIAFATVYGTNLANMAPDNALYAQAVMADFNNDGVVNVDDFIIFATNYGASKKKSVTPTAQAIAPDSADREWRAEIIEGMDCKVETLDDQSVTPNSQVATLNSQLVNESKVESSLTLIEAHSVALLDLYDNQNDAEASDASGVLAESRIDETVTDYSDAETPKTSYNAFDSVLEEELLRIDWDFIN